MSAPSPQAEDTDLTTFTVKVSGSEIESTIELVKLVIDKPVNGIPFARLTFNDGSAAEKDFHVSASSTFLPGNEIEVQLGYQNMNTTVFKGVITGQNIRQGQHGSPVLAVECHDKTLAMTVARNGAYFSKVTDSEVISKLIGNHGLSANVTRSSTQHEKLIQYDATDWNFMLMRAEINSMAVIVDAGKVSVAPPDLSASPVLSLTYGDDIIDFDLNLSADHQVVGAEARSWDFAAQKVVSVAAKMGDANRVGNLSSTKLADAVASGTMNLQTSGPLEQDSLSAWAKSELLWINLAKLRGTVRFQGSALVEPGKTVELAGLGDRFNGTAFVSGVTHKLANGDWQTEVELGLDPHAVSEEVDIVAPTVPGLPPAVSGLLNAVVKEIASDPDGQFRVLVDVPSIDMSGDGVWARLSTNYASDKAGMFFYPEIGDEVILGFLDGDPCFPIIIGSLYSSNTNSPPYTPDSPNTKKAIVTKGGLKVEFDDERRVTTITTPNTNEMIFSDEDQSITIQDQNSNKLTMDSSGISLQSNGKITFNAGGGISGIAKSGDVEIKASGGELKASALNVQLSADAQFSAKGDATAELVGGAEVTVKGAIVHIN